MAITCGQCDLVSRYATDGASTAESLRKPIDLTKQNTTIVMINWNVDDEGDDNDDDDCTHDDNDDHHRNHYAHGEAGTDYGYDDRVHYYG